MEKKYGNVLVIIGVHTPKFDNEKGLNAVRKAMMRYKIDHPVVNDADRKIWNAYGIQSWPSLVMIDPEGFVVGGLASERAYEQLDKAVSYLIRLHRSKGTLSARAMKFASVSKGEKRGPLYFPGKVLADAAGKRLFIADSTNNRIVITDLQGKKLAIAGTGKEGKDDGPFDKATFNEPQGLALRGDTLYVADRANHLIRALNLKTNTVKTVAGTGKQAVFPPTPTAMRGGPPTRIPLNSPWDVLVVGDSLYIAMAGHHQIWKMNLDRPFLALFAGNSNEELLDGPRMSASFAQPSGLASNGKTLWVADSETSSIRAVPLNGTGSVRTLVGKGLFVWGDVDAVGLDARLQHPLGVVFQGGKLYVADSYNGKVKILDPVSRLVTTLAGGFDEPGGLSYADGRLYVADTNHHRIRVINLDTQEVSTLELQGVEPPRAGP